MRGIMRAIAVKKQAEERLGHYSAKLENTVEKRAGGWKKTNIQLRKDISERKRLQQKLQESEKKLRTVCSSVLDAIILLDNEGNISYWNEAAEKIFGYRSIEVLGKDCHIILCPKRYHTDYRKGFRTFKKSGKGPVIGKTLDLIAVKKNGTEFPIKLSAARVKLNNKWNAVGIIRDTTEHKEMEEQFLRSKKLTVLGQLAGGVGHELRNTLGAIKNAAYLLHEVLEDPCPEVREAIEFLKKEVKTSENIISSLLDFARVKTPFKQKVAVNQMILEILSQTVIPENIKVKNQMDESQPPIMADPDQLSQVIRNIIDNAIQSMPKGGHLTVRSRTRSPKWIEVTIADTGVGIERDKLEKIFDPLYSTKAKGVGLGLAVTRILVEGHGGSIQVKSKINQGSTFLITLPLAM